jgi:hypothetical protein
MQDVVDAPFYIDVVGNVVVDKSKMCISKEMRYVVHGTGEEIIDADNPMSFIEESLTEMGSEKTGTSGHHTHFLIILHRTPEDR